MTDTSAAGPAHGFAPLAPLLRAVSLEKLDDVRRRIAKLAGDDLVHRYRTAFADCKRESATGSRVLAFLMSDELTRRQVVPWMRHHHLSTTEYSINQRFDLMVADIRYLRVAYPDHMRVVRYRRCKFLFSGAESVFHSEAAYCFNEGTRAAWKIVKSLSMSEEQQLSCMWLRSAPITNRLVAISAMRDRVFQLLQADLQTTRRTKTFTDDDARVTLLRRHRLWLCSAHTKAGPVEVARIYEALTGSSIDRKVVGRQLQIVNEILRKER